ncbi:amino acid permease [Microbacterium sp. Y-01]|uniref:APC family permease n=1 Tax=Microbacterium sp. Y-01 TaxID=2048898 RepID=UPI000F5F1C80|nr:APC family permease [Microbacterium sp. Y-01]AZH79038.1 amino acid permease [Microbacterium sp. Y-01]
MSMSSDSLESFGHQQELKRSVSTGDLIVYGLVFMVPIAPWAIFGSVYNESQGMVPLVYIIGLVAMIFTALSYAQMSRRVPLAGSVFSYVGVGIHPNLGFFAGWVMLLDYLLAPTMLYVFAAEAMSGIFPSTPRWAWALAFVAVNSIINIAGVDSLKRMNRVFLVIELFFVGVFVVIAVTTLTGGTMPGAEWSWTPVWNPERVTGPLIASALSIAVLSFLGFDGIATMAEESTGGRRSAGRAMITALFVVATLFIGQTWLASMLVNGTIVFPDDQVGTAFYDIVAAASNPGWSIAFLACVVVGAGLANAMAAQAATSRLLFSMSREGTLPPFLRTMNSRQVPRNAILLVTGVSAVLVLFFVGQIDLIVSMVNFGALTGFLLLHLSVVWAFAVRDRSRRWIQHILFPSIGFLIIGYVLINMDLIAKISGACWILVGVVIFLINTRRSRRNPAAAAPTTVVLPPNPSDEPGAASSLREHMDR